MDEQEAREHMVTLLKNQGITDPRVLHAMAVVPRHLFVSEDYAEVAYGDFALPIGHQQTISQPYIVALMTEALEVSPGDRVLEIGTGSGYQAAVLAELGADVYTVERIPALYEEAKTRLHELGYQVHCKLGDGYEGWPEFAPYDGIIVTAAAPEVPPPLLEQLADGGRMVIPLGAGYGYQNLWKITKEGETIHRVNLGGVAFVPFVSRQLRRRRT